MAQGASVAIVGGGIAGLTAALCFARKGIATDIFEKTSALSEVGAGLQLSPNATRILFALGLERALEEVWNEPSSICLVDGSSLRTIASVPAGGFSRKRWDYPYGVLHRADLQHVLLAAIRDEPLCRLHLGTLVDPSVPDELAGVSGRQPRFVVGADGIRSNIRKTIQDAGTIQYSGFVAWRFTLEKGETPGLLDSAKVTAFLGRGAHVVTYPLAHQRFNIVAITQASEPDTPHDMPGSAKRQQMLDAFSGWHDDVRTMMGGAAPTFWPLYEMRTGGWADDDRAVLIGDAAHAMLPFAAQGAAMAIEDAFELAAFTARGETLSAFANHRIHRIARVRSRGSFNRFVYHASGPVRLGRDLLLSMRSPKKLAADLDWLYGYRPRD
ncbi:FAD-dependent monooxygenase [Pararhizobium gei]|uniref:FAD-dependent monooxygenase n=1 Tax=Pararhizobium gei TaxID=1395951 RepID=UPI0023DC50B7|nr:FAD-dependent monooxygenase [Rhizobium gei]